MSLWRTVLAKHPHLWDFQKWPVIEVDTLPRSARKPFDRRRRIVALVLSGISIKEVAQQFSCSSGSITQYMNRCFHVVNGNYALTQALIPYRHVKQHSRVSPLPTLQKPAGSAGALQALFNQNTVLKERLDSLINARIQDRPEIGPLSSAVFHGFFKQLLAETGHPTNAWPSTSMDMGRETLRKYLHDRTAELKFAKRKAQKQQEDTVHLIASPGHQRLFNRVEIDGHMIDFQGRLDIILNEQLLPLRLARAWLYCAVDAETDCILGYVLLDKKSPSRWDVLRLFAHCQRPWTPISFSTPEFHYEPGACLPSGLPERPAMVFHQVALDNAWVHHSQVVADYLVQRQGCSVHMGYAREPLQRNWIEQVFDLINTRLSHRLPSTTGSSVTDPKRESRNNAKNPPRFTWRQFQEALELVLTQHNVRKQGGRLGGATPIDLVRAQLSNEWSPFVSQSMRSSLSPFEQKIRLEVKSRSDGVARHLNFCQAKYPCSSLAALTNKDKKVDVLFDFRDIRMLRVYNMTGHYLGQVQAPRSWQKYAHSMDTRKFILNLVKYDHLRAPDLLSGALLAMVERSSQQLYAQHALRLYTEFQHGELCVIQLGAEADTIVAPKSEKSHRTYCWTLQSADHA